MPSPLIATVTWIESGSSADGAPIANLDPALGPQAAIELPPLPPLETEAIVADAFESARAAASSADAEAVQRLQGVYLGQIRGRLSRVLEMAMAEYPGASGRCEAQIIQNERGEVMEVDLEACAFDARSLHLLAAAIRRASPLPSPPSGLAMGSSLTLDLSRL